MFVVYSNIGSKLLSSYKHPFSMNYLKREPFMVDYEQQRDVKPLCNLVSHASSSSIEFLRYSTLRRIFSVDALITKCWSREFSVVCAL